MTHPLRVVSLELAHWISLLFLFSSKKKIGGCHFHLKQALQTLPFQAKKMWYIALVCNFTEFHLPKLWLYQSWQEFHGVWSCFQNCQKGCFHFGTDFTDIVFRRVKKMGCIARRARTSRTLTFEASTKNWAISLSSRISRSLILLPKFSEGVCLFRQGLHGHCFLKPPQKMGYIALVEDFTEFGLASKTF